MMNTASLFLRSLFALSLLVFAADSHAKTFASESFTLSNGLRIVVVTNHKIPAVTHLICYAIGAKDDPYGKSGIAHFLEHLMFKGTDKFKKGAFSSLVAKNGGNDNAYTSHDYTAYFQTIAKDKLPLVMELEADRMRSMTFDQQEIAKERDVILEERSARTDNDPKALLFEQMSATLFLNHPYGRPVIGWRHEMEGLTRDDAETLYRTYYAPNNALLIVAGDITASELQPLAEKFYGGLQKSLIPPRLELREPPALTRRNVELASRNVNVPEIVRFYLAPNTRPDNYKESAALTVLDHILGGGDTSRLYQSLVMDKALAASVSTGYDPLNLGPSVFSLSVTPRQGQPLESLEKALDAELHIFLKQGITKEELMRSKKLLRADNIYAKESFKTLAFLFGHVLSSGLTTEYLEEWENIINDVTLEDVNSAAQRLLVAEKSVTGRLLPASAAEKP